MFVHTDVDMNDVSCFVLCVDISDPQHVVYDQDELHHVRSPWLLQYELLQNAPSGGSSPFDC